MSTKFLGGIGPGKESAIFNLAGASAASSGNVVIGVSLEPAESVAQRIQEKTTSAAAANGNKPSSTAVVPSASGPERPGGQPSTLVLAQRIIKNAFNFLASFSGTAGQVEVVPLKAFEDWWRKFESRLRSDPGFLERGDD